MSRNYWIFYDGMSKLVFSPELSMNYDICHTMRWEISNLSVVSEHKAWIWTMPPLRNSFSNYNVVPAGNEDVTCTGKKLMQILCFHLTFVLKKLVQCISIANKLPKGYKESHFTTFLTVNRMEVNQPNHNRFVCWEDLLWCREPSVRQRELNVTVRQYLETNGLSSSYLMLLQTLKRSIQWNAAT